jgi:hypothetical protein
LPEQHSKKDIYRIIDANINRAKEGLRVSEEICRFILNSSSFTRELKKIRHKLEAILKGLPERAKLIEARHSSSDVGKNILVNELKRKNSYDILSANLQRVKESVRVLEEFSKLINSKAAIRFKKIRYQIYEAEKKIIKKSSHLKI